MATPRTRNLRLFLSNGLSVEARANLEIIDRLGDVYYVDSTDSVNIRSKTNISLLPADPNVGGSGQADVSIGSLNNRVSNFKIYADSFLMSGTLALKDVAVTSITPDPRKSLIIQYKSDANSSSIDTAADRTLIIDPQGADRALSLAQDFSLAGGFSTTLNTTAATDVTLPTAGTLATRAGTETLTNKTIDANANTLSNISNDSIKAVGGSYLGISYSKLNLANQIKDSDVSNLAGDRIAASKIGISPAGTLVSSNVESALYELQGEIDTKADKSLFEAHRDASIAHNTTSALVGVNDAQTLTNKTLTSPKITGVAVTPPAGSMNLAAQANGLILRGENGKTAILNIPSSLTADRTLTIPNVSGTIITTGSTGTVTSGMIADNTIVNADVNSAAAIAYSKLNLLDSVKNADIKSDAAIAYSKLDLANQIRNVDISSSTTDKIDGTKIDADFGAQSISTDVSVKIGSGQQIELASPTSGFTSSYVLKFPPAQATATDQTLAYDGAGGLKWLAAAGTGTVTNVGLTVPSNLLTVTGSPITTAGTFAIVLPNRAPNTVFAGPASGLSNEPSFRALVPADLPSHTHVAGNITDFAASVNAQVDTLIADSTNVTWTYTPNVNPALSTLTAAINFTGKNTGDLVEGTNQYFTSTRVYEASKTQLVASTGINVTSNDLAKTLTLSVKQSDINTDNITEGSTNLFFTNERAQDAVANLIINSNDLAKTYDDEGNSFQMNLRPEAITTKTQAVPDGTDYILITDTSASNGLRKVLVQDLVNLSGGSYAVDWLITDGISKTVTHNLNSKDIIIQVYDLDTGETVWLDSMKRDTLNTALLTASDAPGTGGWRVLIKRI